MRFIILFFVLQSYLLLAQPSFNKIYDLNSSGGILVNGATDGNMLFLSGGVFHDSIEGLQGIGLIIADTNGNVSGIYPYFDQGGKDLGVGDNYGIQILSDGNIAITGGYFSSYDNVYLTLPSFQHERIRV